MHYFIGVDGGGSGCRAQAAFPDGGRTEILSGGPANMSSDAETASIEISALLQATVTAARAQSGSATEPVVVIGLAGVTESDQSERLKAALPYSHVTIMGDLDIAVSGALEDGDGIVVAVGTGSVLACQRAGKIERLGGYGFLLGDQASGAWIGREALRRALLARDGLGPDGLLVSLIWRRFDGLADMLHFVNSARPADYAALAPLVISSEQEHCPVAGAILDTACTYLARAIAQLQAGATDLPVAAMGSLAPTLLNRLVAQGTVQLNRVAPKGDALDGALWKARQIARVMT